MNILQIGSYLYPDLVGGAEVSAQNIYRLLTEAGHRVVRMRSAVGEASLKTRAKPTGPGEWRAESWRPFEPIVQGGRTAKAVFYAMEFMARFDRESLRALIEEEQIDVAIMHSMRGIGYDILNALADLNVPSIFFLHDFALVCMNKSMVRGGVLCGTSCGQCRVVEGNSRSALMRIDRVALVGPSAQIVERASKAVGIAGLRAEHIPNPNRYAITPRPRGIADQPFTIGYVGRLDAEKGLAGLLPVVDDLASRHDIRFLLAGKGSLEDEVVAFAAERPWVDFRGYVDPSETPKVYDAIDIMTMPSLWPENFPGVAVQAIISGAPVVGFATGGIPEIVDDDVSGRLVPFGDFDALRVAIEEIVEDPARLARMSLGAIESAKRFDPDALAARLLSLIEDVAGVKAEAAAL